MVARGFPRCKPNRIPDKMPEKKNAREQNVRKWKTGQSAWLLNPYPNPNLTLTGSGPFMSLFTHSHSLYLSTLSLSLLINKWISIILHTLYLYLSFSLHAHSLSLSLHTHPLSLSLHTLPLSLSLSKHTYSLPLPLHALSTVVHTNYSATRAFLFLRLRFIRNELYFQIIVFRRD